MTTDNNNTTSNMGGETMSDNTQKGVKMNSHVIYDSRVPEHKARMGGYSYPILERALADGDATWYQVTSFSIPRSSEDELDAALKAARWATIKDNRLVVAFGDFRVRDFGLELTTKDGKQFAVSFVSEVIDVIRSNEFNYGSLELVVRTWLSARTATTLGVQVSSESAVDVAAQPTTADGSKIIKRSSMILRPYRIASFTESLRVLVLPGGKGVDGISLIKRSLVDDAIRSVVVAPDRDVFNQRFQTKLAKNGVFNGSAMGMLIDDDGNYIGGAVKGQFAACEMVGYDIITYDDNIKAEWQINDNCHYAFVGLEPQAAKGYALDGQSVVTNPQFVSAAQMRADLTLDGDLFFDSLIKGEAVNSEPEENMPGMWDNKAFMAELSYKAHLWAMYGLDYRDSPWLTGRIAATHVDKLRVKNPSKVRIPVHHARRIQVVTDTVVNKIIETVNAWRAYTGERQLRPIVISDGEMKGWSRFGMQFEVVTEADYENIVYDNHGGPDSDDFFGVRYGFVPVAIGWAVMYIPIKVAMRSPNTRGEYTIWFWNKPQDCPKVIDTKGRQLMAPVFTKKDWPRQLTTAIANGEVTVMPLPSEDDPTKTSADDRQFLLAYTEWVKEQLVKDAKAGKKHDGVLVVRVSGGQASNPLKALRPSKDGPLAQTARLTIEHAEAFNAKVDAYLRDYKIPQVLLNPAIGLVGVKRDVFMDAGRIVSQARYDAAMVNADLEAEAVELVEVFKALGASATEAAEYAEELRLERMFQANAASAAVIMPFIEGAAPGMERHIRALALWFASLTTLTMAEREMVATARKAGVEYKPLRTDQVIFSTDAFYALVDALVFFGYARKPIVTDSGALGFADNVVFDQENNEWTLECKVCGKVGTRTTVQAVEGFWNNDCTCSGCS